MLFSINPDKKKEQKEIGKAGVEAAFVKAVAAEHWKAFKFTSENNRGVSDRLVMTPGQVWFVEVKRRTGVMSKLQESFMKRCKDFKLNHFVVYGVEDIPKFIKKVKELI